MFFWPPGTEAIGIWVDLLVGRSGPPDPMIPAMRGALQWGGRVVSEPSFMAGSRRDAGFLVLLHSNNLRLQKGEISLRTNGCMVSHDDH
jgi:hypothetical protein